MTRKVDAKDWQKVEELYELGGSDVEAAKLLGMTKAQFESSYKNVPAFQEFIDLCRTKAEAYFNRVARDSIFSKDINTTLLQFVLKNRIGWADRVDTTNRNEEIGEASAAKQELGKLMKKLAEKDPALASQIVLEEIHDQAK